MVGARDSPRAIGPTNIANHYADCAVLQIDSAAAAALLIGACATMSVGTELHPRDWSDQVTREVANAWAQQIDTALRNRGQQEDNSIGNWRARCIVVACLFPIGITSLDSITPALLHLVSSTFDLRQSQDNRAEWILAADPGHLWLAQANLGSDYQTHLLAATGRGTA